MLGGLLLLAASFSDRRPAVSAGASLASAVAARAYAAEQNTIKVALIGCGGRGTGAAVNALPTKGPTNWSPWPTSSPIAWNVGEEPLDQVRQAGRCSRRTGSSSAWTLQEGHRAVAPGGVALLATPPAFRPIHLEYAVAKGCHVFMEKVVRRRRPRHPPRARRPARRPTKKNLKIAGGLMSRHYKPLEEAVDQIHDGAHRRGDHLLGLPRARPGRLHAQAGRA